MSSFLWIYLRDETEYDRHIKNWKFSPCKSKIVSNILHDRPLKVTTGKPWEATWLIASWQTQSLLDHESMYLHEMSKNGSNKRIKHHEEANETMKLTFHTIMLISWNVIDDVDALNWEISIKSCKDILVWKMRIGNHAFSWKK